MLKQSVWIGITIGVFFAGIGVSYAIFSSTYDPTIMKFKTQDMFDQMMSNNPKMTERWMDSMMTEDSQFMLNQLNEMMNDPKLRKDMMNHMMQNQEFMQSMMQNAQMMNKMGLESQDNMMSDMSFNVNAPITMPMIDGYYKGEKVYFVHTEVSDAKMANMMSMMINFPTLHVTELKNIPQENMAKVYVFTNGISGMEQHLELSILYSSEGEDGGTVLSGDSSLKLA